MKNKVEDLRNHLFEAIEMVKSGDLEIDKAKTINDLSQTIINSAKVEVDFLKTTGRATGSGFIDTEARDELPPARPALTAAK